MLTIIVLAAGDDISLADRVKRTAEFFYGHASVFSVSLEYQRIDETGSTLPQETKKLREGKYTLQNLINGDLIPTFGCARAYRSCLFKAFGPLGTSCKIEDATLRLRALILGDIYHSNAAGVLYRTHDKALSNTIKKQTQLGVYRQYMQDLKQALSMSVLQESQAHQAQNVLKNQIKRGLILSKYQSAHYHLGSLFRLILMERHLSFRDKSNIIYGKLIAERHKNLYRKLRAKFIKSGN